MEALAWERERACLPVDWGTLLGEGIKGCFVNKVGSGDAAQKVWSGLEAREEMIQLLGNLRGISLENSCVVPRNIQMPM